MNVKRIFILCLLAAMRLQGQQSLDSAYRTTGQAVVAAFEPQRAVLQKSSAVILDGRDEVAYGVVISADGFILTKASEVTEVKSLTVAVDQTKYPDIKVLAVDPAWDVAILKIPATGLVPVNYAPTSAVPQGTWVVANGVSTRTARRLLAGIISAKIREIPAEGGIALGVRLKDKSKLEVLEVSDKSGAQKAGIQKGDVLLAIDGKKVATVEDIAAALKNRPVDSTVKVTYRRKDVESTVEVRLEARGQMADDMSRNDQMSGAFSPRRSGFPRVLQHDILGARNVTGGPLLDLEGRCLGMNIARANRAESFAIPVEELKEIAARMMKQAGR